MSGHYHHLIQRRDAILSTVRMSPAARARALGRPLYVAPIKTIIEEPKPKPRPKKRLGLGPRAGMTARASQVTVAFCEAFETEIDDVLSSDRARIVARPRQAIMHFLWTETQMSQPQVGRLVQRDHTTVLHGSRVVTNLLQNDPAFSARYHRAVRAIRALWSA